MTGRNKDMRSILRKAVIPAVLAFSIGLPAVFLRINGISLSGPAMEQAETARNLGWGRGYVTAVTRPAVFAPGRDFSRQPAYHQPPFTTLLLTLFLRVVGPADRAAAGASLVFFWLAGLALAGGVKKYFGLLPALFCGLFYFSNAQLLQSAVSGSGVFAESLLLIVAVFLAARAGGGLIADLALGAVLGLGTLAAPAWWWLAAALAVCRAGIKTGAGGRASGWRKTAWRTAARIAGGVLIVNIPWWIFLASAGRGGAPGYLYPDYKMFTSLFPDSSWWRVLNPAAAPTLRQLAFKWRNGALAAYNNLLVVSGTFLAPFFWLALVIRFGTESRARLRLLVAAVCLVLVLEYVIGARRPENLLLIIPWAIALGSAVFDRYRRELASPRPILTSFATGVFVLLNLFPFAGALRFTRIEISPPLSRQLAVLGRELPADAVIVSDQPWKVAWYGLRPAVWLPDQLEHLTSMAANHDRPFFLFLTPRSREYPHRRAGRIVWADVYYGSGVSPYWDTLGAEWIPGDRLLAEIAFPAP